jgi:hypothetical protein
MSSEISESASSRLHELSVIAAAQSIRDGSLRIFETVTGRAEHLVGGYAKLVDLDLGMSTGQWAMRFGRSVSRLASLRDALSGIFNAPPFDN